MNSFMIDFTWIFGKHEQDDMYMNPVVLHCIYEPHQYRV